MWYWARYGVTVSSCSFAFGSLSKEPSHSCQVRVGAMPMQHLRLNEIKCHIIEHTVIVHILLTWPRISVSMSDDGVYHVGFKGFWGIRRRKKKTLFYGPD